MPFGKSKGFCNQGGELMRLRDENATLRARVAELEAREQRIREAAFHPLFNSMESCATIKTILNLAPQTFAESLVRLPHPEA